MRVLHALGVFAALAHAEECSNGAESSSLLQTKTKQKQTTDADENVPWCGCPLGKFNDWHNNCRCMMACAPPVCTPAHPKWYSECGMILDGAGTPPPIADGQRPPASSPPIADGQRPSPYPAVVENGGGSFLQNDQALLPSCQDWITSRSGRRCIRRRVDRKNEDEQTARSKCMSGGKRRGKCGDVVTTSTTTEPTVTDGFSIPMVLDGSATTTTTTPMVMDGSSTSEMVMDGSPGPSPHHPMIMDGEMVMDGSPGPSPHDPMIMDGFDTTPSPMVLDGPFQECPQCMECPPCEIDCSGMECECPA